MALTAFGAAFADADPGRALSVLTEAIAYAREHRLIIWVTILEHLAATFEATHGDLDGGLELFDRVIDSFHQAGNLSSLPYALLDLVVVFDRMQRPEMAASPYGAATRDDGGIRPPDLPGAVEHLRTALGAPRFDERVAAGAAMEMADAVRYARAQIQVVRSELAVSSATARSSRSSYEFA